MNLISKDKLKFFNLMKYMIIFFIYFNSGTLLRLWNNQMLQTEVFVLSS